MSLLKKTLQAKKQQTKSVPSADTKKRSIENALTPSDITTPQTPSKKAKKTEEKVTVTRVDLPNMIVVHEDGELELLTVDPKNPVFKIKGREEPVDFTKDVEETDWDDVICDIRIQWPKRTHLYFHHLDQEAYDDDAGFTHLNIITHHSLIKDDLDEEDDAGVPRCKLGPIFISIGPSEERLGIPIPESFIQDIRITISGLRFLKKHRTPHGAVKDDNRDIVASISITTIFSEAFHERDSESIRLSSCLLTFEPVDGITASDVATGFEKRLNAVLVTHTTDTVEAAQIFGGLFDFLANHRVPFSMDALYAYKTCFSTNDIPSEVFESFFQDFMKEVKTHRFLLVHRAYDEYSRPRTFKIPDPSTAAQAIVPILLY